jgi:mannose-1-phosphate guanylyltransferase
VCNGDLVSDIDLGAMIEAHRAAAAEVSIALVEVAEPSRFGVVALEADGRIGRFVEKPAPGTEPSKLVNAGFWLFSPSVVGELDASTFNRVEDTLFPSMAAGGRRIVGFRHGGYWRDIGTAEAYLDAQLELLGGACPSIGPARASWVARGARIDTAARVERSSVGPRCVIEADALVVDSVLWDEVQVGAGARVRRSVLATGTVVPAGANLDGAVLANGPEVTAGAAEA